MRLDPVRQRLPCCHGCGLQSLLQRNPFTRQVTLAHLQGWCLQLFRLLVNCCPQAQLQSIQVVMVVQRALQKANDSETHKTGEARLHGQKIKGSDFNLEELQR